MTVVRDQHGSVITLANLAQLDLLGSTKAVKWSRRSKLLAYYAITGGLITPEQAIVRWRSSLEEIEEWGRMPRHKSPDQRFVLEMKTGHHHAHAE